MHVLVNILQQKHLLGYGEVLRNKLFYKINRLNNKQIDEISSSKLTNIITNDVVQLETAVAMWIRLVIRVPFICIGALVMCTIISIKCAVILFIATIILAMVTFIVAKKASPLYKISREKLDKLSFRVKENLQNVRVVRGFSAENEEMKKFEKENKENYRYAKRAYIASRYVKSSNYSYFKYYNNRYFIF